MLKDEVLSFLKQHKKFIQKNFGVKKIYLVGSVARGEEKEKSDIDIIVEMESDFNNFFNLKYFLEKNLKKEIDLANLKSIRHYILKKMQKDMINV